ncbi:nitroreductase [Inquilinus sp. OTU3971]|uniref:nitroreductase n=1 Tax=Inquilinus sp. OTU3971 TaxID=3043855 RepID=UPI00313C7ED5
MTACRQGLPSEFSRSVEEAILSRRSVRAFLPDEVPHATIARILEVAARAPSGSNIQPWRVIILTGRPLAALTRELEALALSGDPGEEVYAYYPTRWREPHLARRRKVGWDLYGALGIARGETEKIVRQQARNYLFFGAPVGLLFTIEQDLERGSWLDYGMFLQNIMLAARGFGLDTCPQAAFVKYHRIIASHLDIPAGQMLVCGMALGHRDPDAPENQIATERAGPADFARFVPPAAELPGRAGPHRTCGEA